MCLLFAKPFTLSKGRISSFVMSIDEINKHTHFIYTSLILVMIHAHGGRTLIQVRPLKILDLQMSVPTAVAKSRVWTRCISFHSTIVQINHIQTILTKDILNSVLTVPKKKDFYARILILVLVQNLASKIVCF